MSLTLYKHSDGIKLLPEGMSIYFDYDITTRIYRYFLFNKDGNMVRDFYYDVCVETHLDMGTDLINRSLDDSLESYLAQDYL